MIPAVPSPARRRFLARTVAAPALALAMFAAAGCSSSSEASSKETTTTVETGDTAAEDTTTTTAFPVPPIAEGSKAEICAATKVIGDAGDELSAMLLPALSAEDSPEADKALIDLLPKTATFVDRARVGYERLAAVLPGGLSEDALKVRDTTTKIYGDIAAVKSITELQDVIETRRGDDKTAREASARVETTVKQTCNLSLYGA